MKNNQAILRRSFAAFLLTIGMMCSYLNATAQNTEVPDELRKEMAQLNLDLEKALTKKDIGAIVDLYAADATIISPGGQKIQGRKAIAEYWSKMAESGSLTSEIVELGGNSKLLYQVGRWTVIKTENGVQKTITTDVVIVWKRESNFSYKMQLNSTNNPVAVTGKTAASMEAARP